MTPPNVAQVPGDHVMDAIFWVAVVVPPALRCDKPRGWPALEVRLPGAVKTCPSKLQAELASLWCTG